MFNSTFKLYIGCLFEFELPCIIFYVGLYYTDLIV